MPFDVVLYIIFTLIFALIAWRVVYHLTKSKKLSQELNKDHMSKVERRQANLEKRQNRSLQKEELKKAIALKKAEWKKEDADADKIALNNYKKFEQDVLKYKPIVIKAKQELQKIKDQLKEIKKKIENDKDNNNLIKQLNEVQEIYNEEFSKYQEINKTYERFLQKLRIEKNRISLGYKIERWSKRGGRLRRELFVKRQYYYLVAPYVILFFIFTVVPVLMSLYLSFTNFNLLETPDFVGWENYMRLFVDDKVFVTAIKNTLILAVVTGPLSYLSAFVFAWLINELRPKLRSFMTLIFYAPSISGNVYLVWKLIFSSDIYGYANSFLIRLNIINEPITWLTDEKYIIWIIMIVQLWLSLGVSFLAFIAGLQSCDKTLYEAGAIDGIKNRWQELWYITLPQMKSQLMFGAVMQITSSLSVAEVATQIAGFPSVNYAGHTIITHLMDYGSIRMEMGYASSIATILFIIMILANILVRKILRRVGN